MADETFKELLFLGALIVSQFLILKMILVLIHFATVKNVFLHKYLVNFICPNKIVLSALDGVAQLVEALSCTPKGCGFNSWSEHTPRLWV